MNNVLEYLEASARRTPNRTAVADADTECTYQQLLKRSQEIGTWLSGRISCRQGVACFLEKSCACLQAFFGIVYAGGFYSLVDPTFPRERIGQILSVLNPAVILTTRAYEAELQKLPHPEQVVFLEDIPNSASPAVLYAIRKRTTDTDPLYCNFTSGSTGVPKGVLVCHRSVIDFINVFTGTFGLSDQDVFGNQAPFDFDVSVKDIYSSICVGGKLVLIPKSYFMFPARLVEMLEQHKVTTLIWAVSALCMVMRLHALKHLRPSAIRRILFSGEVMPIKQFNQWQEAYPNAMFVNLYGPTEITCNCTYYIVNGQRREGERIPMGIPFDNEQVFLLDEQDRLVTGSGSGEVCVAGTCLALGYYRNPEQTRRAFVQNPLNPDYPETIYRTGDLAAWENGNLVFLGRKDFQIKHMGHRIELEEIEAALSCVEGVSHACCVYDTGRNKVVAFYCGEAERAAIVDAMKQKVPEYMIPNVFQKKEQLPLTRNGKTDRKALAAMLQGGK